MTRTDSARWPAHSRRSWTAAAVVIASLGAAVALRAQAPQSDHDTASAQSSIELPAPNRGVLSEVRVGLLAHDLPVLGPQREHGSDLNTELLFVSPVSEASVARIAPAARWLFRPRPDIGLTQNFYGYTSQEYLGLDWTASAARGLFRRQDALLFDIGFGGAVNNDPTLPSTRNRLHLGSNLLFHPSLQVGYAFDSHNSIGLYYEHSSNAHLARVNEGLNNIGLRFGRQL